MDLPSDEEVSTMTCKDTKEADMFMESQMHTWPAQFLTNERDFTDAEDPSTI